MASYTASVESDLRTARLRIEAIERIAFKTERLPNGEWSAIDDNTYDGPGSLYGLGNTEDEAVDDLIDQMMERA